MSRAVLTIDDLVVRTRGRAVVLDGVSLRVAQGESIGLVGESGSGKTTLAQAVLGFTRPGLVIESGSVRVGGEELVGRGEKEKRSLRGRLVSYVPQDPATALNPSIRVGDQIGEICRMHASGSDIAALVSAALERVGLPTDERFRRRYPHQLSGGQQQRVAIAGVLSCDPPLVVFDEPTTGLDVVTQARILNEMSRIQRELGIALVYVSHDLAAVASVTERVAVMYAGQVVETAPTAVLVARPRHPYTRGLISSVPDCRRPRGLRGIPGVASGVGQHADGCRFAPRCELRVAACTETRPPLIAVTDRHGARCLRADDVAPPGALPRVELPSTTSGDPLIEVDGLIAEHRSSHEVVLAADAVTFGVRRGRCVALVGESGSGKTTIARCIVGLHERAGGSILFDGQPLAALARRRTREQRRRIQIVFQNPYESLNPRQPAGEAVAWPARALRGLSRDGAMRAATEVLDRVRLPARIGSRYPGELSGGERQRVAIARALAAQPDLLVCDEITSALDVSVQAAVLGLLRELQLELGLTLLFITHDLGVVASVADEVLVLERGVVHERGSVGAVLGAPQQQYTQQLIGAAPSLAVTQPDVTSTAAPPAQDPS